MFINLESLWIFTSPKDLSIYQFIAYLVLQSDDHLPSAMRTAWQVNSYWIQLAENLEFSELQIVWHKRMTDTIWW